jgi:hypothetical protein
MSLVFLIIVVLILASINYYVPTYTTNTYIQYGIGILSVFITAHVYNLYVCGKKTENLNIEYKKVIDNLGLTTNQKLELEKTLGELNNNLDNVKKENETLSYDKNTAENLLGQINNQSSDIKQRIDSFISYTDKYKITSPIIIPNNETS